MSWSSTCRLQGDRLCVEPGLDRTCATSARDRHASDGLSQFPGLGLPSVRISRKYGEGSPADMKRSISLIRVLAD